MEQKLCFVVCENSQHFARPTGRRQSILMTCQYEISAVVLLTSFHRATSGGLQNVGCFLRLFYFAVFSLSVHEIG